MFNTIGWFIRLALEVLALCAGCWLFGYIVKNGTGSIKDFMRTIGMTIKVICVWIRNKLIDSVKKEREAEKGGHEPKTYDDFCKEYGFPTKEEFEEKIRNHDPMSL